MCSTAVAGERQILLPFHLLGKRTHQLRSLTAAWESLIRALQLLLVLMQSCKLLRWNLAGGTAKYTDCASPVKLAACLAVTHRFSDAAVHNS